MERNVKLFPLYRIFACDMLFYYAIQALFLMQIKGLTISQVGMITSFYCLFYVIAPIPCSIICDRIGLKKSMLIGNIFLVIYCILIMILNTYIGLIFSELICAIGFSLKGCAESPFIYSSLKKLGRESEHSKVESKGDSLYFIIEGIACILSGYLYSRDSYLPIILATLCFCISSFISYLFKPIARNKNINSRSEYFSELRAGFKFIFKSNRLRALMIFSFMFVGIFSVAIFLLRVFLTGLKTSPEVFGYIYAIMAVASALGAVLQKNIETKFKNKTLTSIALTFITTIILTGVLMYFRLPAKVLLIIGGLFFFTQAFIKGIFWITIRIYLTRYTTSAIRPKIMSIYNLTRNLGSFIFLTLVTSLVEVMNLQLSFILVGVTFFIIIILVATYMNNKVGLDPSKYTVKDRIDLVDDNVASTK